MLKNVCKVESTKKYNSGNENHPSEEGTMEIDIILLKNVK